jgi:2-octaprenylphenol hydroxylase
LSTALHESSQSDIAIAGAGAVGLASALALAKQGYRITLIDPDQEQPVLPAPYDLRTYALTPASMRFFERLGVANWFDRERLEAFQGMRVWDGNSAGSLEFSAAALGRECLGYIIEDSNLRRALHTAVERCDSIIRRYDAVTDVKIADANVELMFGEPHTSIRSRLLLGCDGAKSHVRSLLGIEAQRTEYTQHSLVCNVEVEQVHDSVARQRFLRDGPVAFLPLPDKRSCAVVWSTSPEQASMALNAPAVDFEQLLGSAFANTLGRVTLRSERAVVPLQRLHTAKYVTGRSVLLGDAAHVVHPLAGQGLNLGLMDAAALAECLGPRDKLNLEFPRSALRRFERMRRGENLAMLSLTDQLNRLFRDNNPLVESIRAAGMVGVSRFWPLKTWLMLRAMGDVGDVPALAARG